MLVIYLAPLPRGFLSLWNSCSVSSYRRNLPSEKLQLSLPEIKSGRIDGALRDGTNRHDIAQYRPQFPILSLLKTSKH